MTLIISDVADGSEAEPGFMVDAKCGWPWWWSRDQERYMGPHSSRSDAIMDAWSNDATGGVHVMQAKHDELNCKVFTGDEIADAFDGANEDAQDAEGNSLSSEIRAECWAKIAASVNYQILTAIREKGVTAWGFSAQTPGDWVDLSEPRIGMLPPEARELFAEIASGYDPAVGFAETYVDRQVARLKVILAAKAAGAEPV